VRLQDRLLRLVRHPARIGPAVSRRLRLLRRQRPAPAGISEPRLVALGGSEPGPPASPAERRGIMTMGIDLEGCGLEIGPSIRPLLPKSAGFNIRTADHLDQAGLAAKYGFRSDTNKIEVVDYVLTGSRLTAAIHDTFDYIVASHVVEHTVCLVAFLQDARTLLNPGGVLSLAVPDHRFSFDRFRERSSLARVIEVYRAAPSVHSEGAVLDYYLNVVRKGPEVSWSSGAGGDYANVHTHEEALSHAADAVRGEYVDVHNWIFTPHHFRLLIEDLFALGLIEVREKAFHDTRGPEFFVTLGPDGAGPDISRHELMRRSAEEVRVADAVRFADAVPFAE
jgi:SAM-dependent methyltransferase